VSRNISPFWLLAVPNELITEILQTCYRHIHHPTLLFYTTIYQINLGGYSVATLVLESWAFCGIVFYFYL
jgi:hypothetical protein